MTTKIRERVAEIVEAALEHAPEERAHFIDTACAGDAVLHAEVESLLKFQDHARNAVSELDILAE